MNAMPATAKRRATAELPRVLAAGIAFTVTLWWLRRARAAAAAEKQMLELTVERLTRPGAGQDCSAPAESRPLLRECA